jgi:hypothetical protein
MRAGLSPLGGDTSMWFYLATIAWSDIFALPPFICETPSLPPTKYASYVLEALFFRAMNHLSQCVRYRAEGRIALRWYFASVVNNSARQHSIVCMTSTHMECCGW